MTPAERKRAKAEAAENLRAARLWMDMLGATVPDADALALRDAMGTVREVIQRVADSGERYRLAHSLSRLALGYSVMP